MAADVGSLDLKLDPKVETTLRRVWVFMQVAGVTIGIVTNARNLIKPTVAHADGTQCPIPALTREVSDKTIDVLQRGVPSIPPQARLNVTVKDGFTIKWNSASGPPSHEEP